MSIVGLFDQNRPQIGGLYFDAILEESTELVTDVTQFPVETGATGNDHAVQRPLQLSMIVGVSDNAFRALKENTGVSTLGIASSVATGGIISTLDKDLAALAGLSATAINAAYLAGQSKIRSQSVLDQIRAIQRSNSILNVITLKREYRDVMITSTRQRTTRENVGGLELVIGMTQLLTKRLVQGSIVPIPAINDPAENQAQPERDLGLVVPQ